MGPFDFPFSLSVQVPVGIEFLDCKCYAHKNDYRIIGGKISDLKFHWISKLIRPTLRSNWRPLGAKFGPSIPKCHHVVESALGDFRAFQRDKFSKAISQPSGDLQRFFCKCEFTWAFIFTAFPALIKLGSTWIVRSESFEVFTIRIAVLSISRKNCNMRELQYERIAT